MYIILYNIMAIKVSQYFLIFFTFILIIACILTVLLKNISLFTLGLIGLSITLFSLNICSILGFCPNDVELVKYAKNQTQCTFKKNLFLISILAGILVPFLLFISSRIYKLF